MSISMNCWVRRAYFLIRMTVGFYKFQLNMNWIHFRLLLLIKFQYEKEVFDSSTSSFLLILFLIFFFFLEPHKNKNRWKPKPINPYIKSHLKSKLQLEYDFYYWVKSRLHQQFQELQKKLPMARPKRAWS